MTNTSLDTVLYTSLSAYTCFKKNAFTTKLSDMLAIVTYFTAVGFSELLVQIQGIHSNFGMILNHNVCYNFTYILLQTMPGYTLCLAMF